jgi:nickel-dependent lactate racemase
MVPLDLPSSSGNLSLTLPGGWIGQIAQPQSVAPASNPSALIAAALNQPLGTPPLSQLASPRHRVAIIVDDYTRKTPVHQLLPLVLQQLLSAGVKQSNISIVAALGTHRPMTDVEIRAKVGAEIADQYKIVNTPSTDQSQMVYLGLSSNNIPAWINRTVAEADLRIGLGMITPHLDTGFSGGAKIVLPGVSSELTVNAFHTETAFVLENQLGKIDAPLRINLEQFVRDRIPLDFIVNVVITLDGEIYQCVAGHFIEAHRAGVRHAQVVFGTPAGRRYPVVISNCYPYDIDWWQSAKGIFAGDLLTADGGTLIAVTAAPEGHSTYPLYPHYLAQDPDQLRKELRVNSLEGATQAAAAAQMGHLRQRIRLVLVSSGLTQAEAAAMQIPYYQTVQAAVEAEVGRLPEEERHHAVGIVPMGGIVLPL